MNYENAHDQHARDAFEPAAVHGDQTSFLPLRATFAHELAVFCCYPARDILRTSPRFTQTPCRASNRAKILLHRTARSKISVRES
jgi:hypothetical protein